MPMALDELAANTIHLVANNAMLNAVTIDFIPAPELPVAYGDAVQIHGANGCSSDFSVQRYLRDAKIMEIIEGSTQLQQTNIAKYAFGYEERA